VNVFLIVKGRYPTEKAYGVTLTETIRSLSKLGHKVSVLSIKSNYINEVSSKNYYDQINFNENSFQKLLRLQAYKGKNIISIFAWKLYWKMLLKVNMDYIRKSNSDLYWIRDLDLVKYIPHTSGLILELHSIEKDHRLQKALNTRKNTKIVLAPISKKIFSVINKYKVLTSIEFSPMGIDTDLSETLPNLNSFVLRISELKQRNLAGLRIGYMGKFFPGGYSKGVEDLFTLAKLNIDNQLGYEISITGGDVNDLKKADKLIPEFNLNKTAISIKGHVQHKIALNLMKELDVIVLPQPRSSKYVGFPLKCIEAVSSGRIVIAADCELYRDIFTEHFQPYWYDSGVSLSMNNAIISAINDPQLETRITEGINFANKFSWDSRTIRLLNSVKNL
jgi:glycosyltransferase involved in cell wall biosynthesis